MRLFPFVFFIGAWVFAGTATNANKDSKLSQKKQIEKLTSQLDVLRQKLSEIETLLHSLKPSEQNQAQPSAQPGQKPHPDYSVKEFLYKPDKKEELKKLKEIEVSIIDNPMGKEQRRNLKNFILSAIDESVKAEALFFLGELHYFRQNTAQAKPKDVPKALALFSRSISLAPHSARAPKTWVRVAQCLSKAKRYSDARRVLDKIKSEYASQLNIDLAQEYKKVYEAIEK